MSFSMCLNKNEILLLSGFGLLFQGVELDRDGKLIRDSQKLVSSAAEILERNSAPCAFEFKRVACSVMAIERSPTVSTGGSQTTPSARRASDGSMHAQQKNSKSTRKQLHAIASRFSFNNKTPSDTLTPRRSTVPAVAPTLLQFARNGSTNSIVSVSSEPDLQQGNSSASSTSTQRTKPRFSATTDLPNLDYLPLGSDVNLPSHTKSAPAVTDWDRLLGFIDSTQPASYDAFFPTTSGVQSTFLESDTTSPTPDWSLDAWGVSADGQESAALSVLSFEEESLTSGEEFGSTESGGGEGYRGIMIPNVEGFGLEGLDGGFGL